MYRRKLVHVLKFDGIYRRPPDLRIADASVMSPIVANGRVSICIILIVPKHTNHCGLASHSAAINLSSEQEKLVNIIFGRQQATRELELSKVYGHLH